jgi:transaldolase
MKATRQLHDLGQSIWLDSINRELLDGGALKRYIGEFSVSGLTSNPTIFDQAFQRSEYYDDAIYQKAAAGLAAEELFIALALDDLREAAELLREVHEDSRGLDGWVSLEVSPLLADDSAATIESALTLHRLAACPNLMIKIPGTVAGTLAIEEAVFAGVPVNVTLLFSPGHYLAAAGAYMRGIERRIHAGLDPDVPSVASLFVSRWDSAVAAVVPAALRNRLGITIARLTYRAYRDLLESEQWRDLAKRGARPQRLLFASTGTKDKSAPDTLYVEALAAPDTINTMPEQTLLAFAEHGKVGPALPRDGGDAVEVLAQFVRAGVDDVEIAASLQRAGAEAFSNSWTDLLNRLAVKSAMLKHSAQARARRP